MKVFGKSLLMAIVLSLPASAAISADQFDWPINARKAEMTLRAFNLGQLGAMAKGDMEYDAEVATAAANNLKILSSLDGMAMWPQGSDNVALGDRTKALPALWEEFPKVMVELEAFSAAVDALADAAGKDLDSLRGAMGPVGKSCGSCHGKFRAEM